MQYLMIENEGEAPVEAFTMLGLSTARGDSESIGQFGTGAKHGILLLLRDELEPHIYTGKTRITPFTETNMVDNHAYERICFRIGNKTEKSSMTLDFGSLDWGDVGMALREFICNALDSAEQDWSNIRLEAVEKPRAKAGTTRIFVPMNSEVKRYLYNISTYFLHPNGYNVAKLIPNNGDTPRFYRKGVLVREVAHARQSLYHYNGGDELPIDECRNLDDWRCRNYAAAILSSDKEAVKKVLQKLVEGEDNFWESHFSHWHLQGVTVAEAFAELYPGYAIVDNPVWLDRAIEKGVKVKIITQGGWYEALTQGGIDGVSNIFDELEKQGHTVVQAKEETIEKVRQVWNWLVELNLHDNKPFPKVAEFIANMDGGKVTNGFYKDGTVYLNNTEGMAKSTILEELAHYITGAADNTRDFQDYFIRMCVMLSELVFD